MDISSGQQNYDRLVSNTGCAGADDTLDCLRDVPYEKLKQGVEDLSPGMFSYKVCDSRPPAIRTTDGLPVGLVLNMADNCG